VAHSLEITARALREIDEALEWLARRSRRVALRWHQQLLEAVESLAENPQQYGLAPEAEWYPGELRQLLHGKKRAVYRILFEVRGESVYILRVCHSSHALFQRGEL
jgi:plasmid stabilization system protein ParE